MKILIMAVMILSFSNYMMFKHIKDQGVINAFYKDKLMKIADKHWNVKMCFYKDYKTLEELKVCFYKGE